MHFSDEHQDLIWHFCNGNRIVPREKLMSIDMLIIQLSWIAPGLLRSSFRRKCVPSSRSLHSNRFGVVARLRHNLRTSLSSCGTGTTSPFYLKFGTEGHSGLLNRPVESRQSRLEFDTLSTSSRGHPHIWRACLRISQEKDVHKQGILKYPSSYKGSRPYVAIIGM